MLRKFCNWQSKQRKQFQFGQRRAHGHQVSRADSAADALVSHTVTPVVSAARLSSQRTSNSGEKKRKRKADLVFGKAGQQVAGYERPLSGVERVWRRYSSKLFEKNYLTGSHSRSRAGTSLPILGTNCSFFQNSNLFFWNNVYLNPLNCSANREM